jgi:NitT/TauT family transport system permease protein
MKNAPGVGHQSQELGVAPEEPRPAAPLDRQVEAGDPVGTAPRPPRRPRSAQWAAAPLALVVAIVLWQVVLVAFDVPGYLVPTPVEVRGSLTANWAPLLGHTWVTLAESLIGFGLSVAIGVPLAMLIVSSRVLERILYPLLVASQAVPKVALAPLLVVWMGYGVGPKVVVALLIAFFPVVVNTATGLSAVQSEMIMLVRSMGASRWDVFRKIRFPTAVPSVLAGFKVAIALAVVGAVVGEFVGSRSGLGYYLLVATGNFDTPLVFACIVVLTILGVVLFYAVSGAGRLLGRWNRGTEPGESAASWSS